MPYLGSTLFVTSLLVGLFVSMTAYFLLVRAVWPRFAERVTLRWQQHPVRSFFLGLPIGVVLFGASAGLLNLPGGAKGIGFVAASLTAGFTLAGMSGLAGRIGAGLAKPNDEGSEWRQTLRGGVVLVISCLMPLLGWFLIFPIALVGGVGAAAQALFSKSKAPARADLAPHLQVIPAAHAEQQRAQSS